ncbi:MAG: hypothetical protein HC824_03805 [Synechococcales cyanobacterium RM1_1_8]|nr:hypothetical protein [Synechococcales cyanobacterium RM1_1_8]
MASPNQPPKPNPLSIASDKAGTAYKAVSAREILPIPSNLDDRDLILREQFSVDDLRLICLWLSGFAGDYQLCHPHNSKEAEAVTDFTTALTARLRAITHMAVTQPGGAAVSE